MTVSESTVVAINGADLPLFINDGQIDENRADLIAIGAGITVDRTTDRTGYTRCELKAGKKSTRSPSDSPAPTLIID